MFVNIIEEYMDNYFSILFSTVQDIKQFNHLTNLT